MKHWYCIARTHNIYTYAKGVSLPVDSYSAGQNVNQSHSIPKGVVFLRSSPACAPRVLAHDNRRSRLDLELCQGTKYSERSSRSLSDDDPLCLLG